MTESHNEPPELPSEVQGPAASKEYQPPIEFQDLKVYAGKWLKAIYDRQTVILERIETMSAHTDALKTAFDGLATKVNALIAKATDLQGQVASHADDDAAVDAVTQQVTDLSNSIPS